MNLIAYWRRELGLTQEELSYLTGVPRSRLGLIERQFTEPTEMELAAIEEAFSHRCEWHHLNAGEDIKNRLIPKAKG